jgi:mono/diheme cytochrome c family protein
VTQFDLKEAIEAVLAGKPVKVPVTQAYGCPIQKPESGDATNADGKVTFNRDVLPILQNHCQACHRPGEVGPFSLMTYRQAVKWADDMREYTQARKMPPWKPVASHGLFQNERALSDQQIATLARWVKNGKLEGDPNDLPAPRQFTDGWQLGRPDLVLEVADEMTIGATGPDLFRCFVLPTQLKEDKFVTAIEVRPGNKRVVHHTLQFIDTRGQGRRLEEGQRQREKKPEDQDHGPGYTVAMGAGFPLIDGGLGGWAPGNLLRHLPDGVGYFLPKESDIIVQVHYHRTGKVERDRVRIGLHFAKKPVTHRYLPVILAGLLPFQGKIPAGAERHRVQGQVWVNEDVTLHSVMPHMHLLGREIKATMTLPDGTTRQLIAIKDWDYNWQETYYFREPIKAPAGTRFDVEAFYDNSQNNPLNPNQPPKDVYYGEQTTDEMCFVFLGVTADEQVTPPEKLRRIKFGRQAPRKADATPEDN